MQSFRRAALRTALAASRQATPKASTAPFTSQIARRVGFVPLAVTNSARCFSQSAHVQADEDAAVAKEESAPEQLPEAPLSETSIQDNKTPHAAFVRNLIFDATEEHLKTAFEKYGEVAHAYIHRDPRGLSKGFGFVYFTTAEALKAACENVNGSFWHGRRVTCVPKMKNEGKTKRAPNEPTTTLYVGNFPYETTDAELNKIFGQLNNIKDIRVAVDRVTGWPRGFAHCEFADIEAATNAYKILAETNVGGRRLVVDYSTNFTRRPLPSNEIKNI